MKKQNIEVRAVDMPLYLGYLAINKANMMTVSSTHRKAHVDLHSDSQASVWAEEKLETSLFHRSKLRYRGIPRMRVSYLDKGCSI